RHLRQRGAIDRGGSRPPRPHLLAAPRVLLLPLLDLSGGRSRVSGAADPPGAAGRRERRVDRVDRRPCLRPPRRPRRRVRCGVLAIAPVTLRNLVRGGELIPISWNGGINLYIGNNPDYDQTVAIRPDLHWKRFVQEPHRAGVRTAAGASSYFVAKVIRYVASD